MANQWSQAKIQQYIIDGVEESLTLEYKAADSLGKSDAKKKEITKDASAMANSAGGVLIYGVKEFDLPQKKHLPERLDAVDRKEFTKEWLEQVINNIRPHIEGIIIQPVNLATGTNDVLYIVEIPTGTTAHQATDHRYYKRFNFQSVPMEDYEIRDVMSRQQHPKFELIFRVSVTTKYERDGIGIYASRSTAKTACTLKVKANNVGGVYAQYVNCIIKIPRILLEESKLEMLELKGRKISEYYQYYEDNTIRDIVDVEFIGLGPVEKYGPSRFNPILPGLSHIWEIPITNKFLNINLDEANITWIIYADNALPAEGVIALKDVQVVDMRKNSGE